MSTAVVGICIAVVAFLALIFSSASSAVQILIALPGSGGLLLALWAAVRSAEEQKQEQGEPKGERPVGRDATVHMIETAFDKHVEFCERYTAKANEGLSQLFQEGPTEKALHLAGELFQIRRAYVLWETDEVAAFLDKFERAFRKIGADRYYLKSVEAGADRTSLVTKLYETFKNFIQLDALPASPTSEIAVTFIIARLRDHLGLNELAQLRLHTVAAAVKAASSNAA